MARRAIHAARQNGIVSDPRGTQTPKIFSASSSLTGSETVTSDSALTTYTSYSTSTFVSAGTTYKASQGVPVIVSNSAQFSSLSTAGAFNTQLPSSTITSAPGGGTAGAATATSSAASAHQSSSIKTSTLILAILVPILFLLLASFAAFFLFMRRRHHRALEEEARFEDAKIATSRASPPDNNSSRNLIPAGAAYGHGADEKPKQSVDVQARPLPDRQATGPPRPRRPEDYDIPSSAIGIARSTSSASAVYTNGGPRPPRSAHEMRGLPSNPRPDKRVPRSQVLSGGDIIDSYADMRPSTAPSGSGRDYSSPSNVMRTPLPIKPMGRPPPKNTNQPPPQYTSNSAAQSPLSHSASSALWPASSQARNTPTASHGQSGSPDNSYGLTAENLRIAKLVNGSSSSLGMARQTPDNASISDFDEHDDARAARDDVSDISDLDEEQERMASRGSSPMGMGTGRGTPASGRWGTPMSGRGFIR
jgi:hypothetical protein